MLQSVFLLTDVAAQAAAGQPRNTKAGQESKSTKRGAQSQAKELQLDARLSTAIGINHRA
jgi:hypothetical protein